MSLSSIPEDVLLSHIFGRLDLSDVLCVSCVSRYLHWLVQRDEFWRILLINHFQATPPPGYHLPKFWKEAYRLQFEAFRFEKFKEKEEENPSSSSSTQQETSLQGKQFAHETLMSPRSPKRIPIIRVSKDYRRIDSHEASELQSVMGKLLTSGKHKYSFRLDSIHPSTTAGLGVVSEAFSCKYGLLTQSVQARHGCSMFYRGGELRGRKGGKNVRLQLLGYNVGDIVDIYLDVERKKVKYYVNGRFVMNCKTLDYRGTNTDEDGVKLRQKVARTNLYSSPSNPSVEVDMDIDSDDNWEAKGMRIGVVLCAKVAISMIDYQPVFQWPSHKAEQPFAFVSHSS